MTTRQQTSALRRVVEIVAGVLALILFMWTPKSSKGVLIFFAILLGTLIVAALSLALKRPDTGEPREL